MTEHVPGFEREQAILFPNTLDEYVDGEYAPCGFKDDIIEEIDSAIKENAITWLDRATEDRTAEVIHFKCEPIYDPIRDEPNFRALIRKIGLER